MYTLHGPPGEAHWQSACSHTRATPAFLRSHASHQPSTSFERDQREGHQREANVREDGQEHHGRVRAARTEGAITTQHMANSHQFMLAHVHRWRSPPTAIYMAEARSPRALPTPSPKWTVLGRASPHRSAAVAATAVTVSVGEGREAGGAMGDEGTSPPDVVLCHMAMGRFVLLSLSHRSSSHACCRHSHLAAGMAMESTECNPCACTPISISR